MKRSRKQLMMVILYAAAVLCFAFGDAFKITALLWVMLGLLVAGSVLLILLGRCPYCKLGIPAFSQYCPYCGEEIGEIKAAPRRMAGRCFPDTFIF